MARHRHPAQDAARRDPRQRSELNALAPSPSAPGAVFVDGHAGALARARFAFAVFAFVAASHFFNRFGLISIAFAALYAGGGLLIGHAALERERAPDRAAPWSLPVTTIVLAFPVWCLASVAWSADPAVSLRNAFQLLVTGSVGILIGRTLGLEGTMRALGAAMLVCVGASLLNLVLGVVPAWSQDDFVGAPAYLVGVYDQKNSFGYTVALLAWATLQAGLARGRAAGAVACAIALALFPVLRASGSSTALILYALVLSMPLCRVLLHVTGSVLLSAMLGAAAACLVLLATGLAGTSVPELVLSITGKDATLTGRTEMWDVAFAEFARHPVTGVGYQVFWTSEAFAPQVALVQATVLEGVTNFHSAWIEALVGTGLVGALALALLPLTVLGIAVARLVRDATPAALGACYLAAALLTRSVVEASLYFQHQIDFLLLTALATALGSGARRPPRPVEPSVAPSVAPPGRGAQGHDRARARHRTARTTTAEAARAH